MAGQAIEPDAGELLRDRHSYPADDQVVMLASIAISLYRIANRLDRTEPEAFNDLVEGLRAWLARGGFK